MNKNIIAIIVGVIIIFGGIVLSGIEINSSPASTPKEGSGQEMTQLIDCLEENNLVIYGSKTCPACQQLVASLGGYETVEPIYVECSQGTEKEMKRCREETKTNYVPEIQIGGKAYDGSRTPSSLASQVGCEY